MNTEAIRVENLSKEFTYWAERPNTLKSLAVNLFKRDFLEKAKLTRISVLEDVSFTIDQGDFVGIMGRNGVGKSTLLRLLAGIYKPTKGKVSTNGRIAPLIELGAGFSEELSGYENIFLNAAILGFSRKDIKKHLNSIIDFTELGERIHMPVRNYSSGMLVRLGFSIATHVQAPILLLDEVLAVGDLGFQRKCHDKIKALHSEGRTIILVTHSPDAVAEHCKKALLFDNKRLALQGAAAQIAEAYRKGFNP